MDNEGLIFRGGKNMALLPMLLFIVSCSLFFSVFHVFDMTALAMLAFLAIMIGAIFHVMLVIIGKPLFLKVLAVKWLSLLLQSY